MKASKLSALLSIMAATAIFSAACSKSNEPPPVTDDTITAQVESVLHNDPITAPYKFKVATANGAVHIVGDTNNGGEKDKVAALTKAVPGVKSLVNDITVHDH